MSKKISELEFIALMASLMAVAAISIDALLPALDTIANSIGITDPKNNQLLVTMIFLGMGIGQMVSGALSDSIGRKPVVYYGYGLFTVASIICVFATNLEVMVLGRLLQGLGLSAPRSVSIAIVRDKYNGDQMARVMSFISVVFILAPVVAPSLGKVLLDAWGWKSIFYSQLIFGIIGVIWLWKRQPETLNEENKRSFNLSLFSSGIKAFFKQRTTVIYTLVMGIVSAPFLVYISSSQHIFEEQYNLKEIYPYIFSGLAIAIGLSAYLNGVLVVKVGMSRLSNIATIVLIIVSGIYVLLFHHENPSSSVLIVFLALMLFLTGFIVGNLNALAMQPIGHIAGIGSAILGFLSTIVTFAVATLIGQFVDTTAAPIFIGLFGCCLIGLLLTRMIKVPQKVESENNND